MENGDLSFKPQRIVKVGAGRPHKEGTGRTVCALNFSFV